MALAVLGLMGCAAQRVFKPYMDPNGIFRVREEGNYWGKGRHAVQQNLVKGPEGALRSSDGALASTSEQSTATFDKHRNPSDLYEVLEAHRCGEHSLYKANLAQKKALRKIKELNFQDARSDLNFAADICPQLGWISYHYYLEAIVAKGLNEPQVVKTKLEDFLKYASAVEPRGFFSMDYDLLESQDAMIQTLNEELAFYRTKARQYLAQETDAIPLSSSDLNSKYAMMYPNNPFRPGGSDTPGSIFIPAIGYSSITGSVFGVTIFRSWGKDSISPTFVTSTAAGSLYGAQFRHGLYESNNRDTNIDALVYGNSWKELSYSYDVYSGRAKDVRIVREGFNYGGGFGATRRFLLPSLGVSSEVIVEQNTTHNEFRTYGTFYGFCDIIRGVDIFSGWLRNQPIVGITIIFVKIGYNPNERSIVTLVNGISF